jgi:hypothetical protein
MYLKLKSFIRTWQVSSKVLVYKNIKNVFYKFVIFIELINILKIRILLKFSKKHLNKK